MTDLKNAVQINLHSSQKKKRLRGLRRVENFNELCTTPDNFDPELQLVKPPLKRQRLSSSSECSESLSDNESFEADESSSSESSGSSSSESSPEVVERFSSPVGNQEWGNLSFSVSSFTVRDYSETAEYIVDRSADLFSGSRVNVNDASTLIELFCSKFSLSDEASNSLHSIVRGILPNDNNFPSGYAYIQNIKRNFNEHVRYLNKTSKSALCVLHFKFQLRDILVRNFTQILNYSEFRKQNPGKDFQLDFLPPVQIKNNNLVVTLTLFTDGVNIKKSTFKKELWPVWLQIADLPPKLRMAQRTIVLAALYVGAQDPNWHEVVPLIWAELLSTCTLSFNSGLCFEVLFKVKLIVCDLGAKSHVLNMLKFNGFFGCHYCTAEGETIGRTHSYYPFDQIGQIREPAVNDAFIRYTENLPSDKKKRRWREREECICQSH